MRAALIDSTGLVDNVIIVDPDADPATAFVPPDGFTLVELNDDSPVGPGWTRKGKKWLAPTPEPTAPPSNIEALAALLDERGITAADLAALLGGQ